MVGKVLSHQSSDPWKVDVPKPTLRALDRCGVLAAGENGEAQ
jgi:hypothetical protein